MSPENTARLAAAKAEIAKLEGNTTVTATPATAPRTSARAANGPVPLNARNLEVTEDTEFITLRFRKGVALGLTSGEQNRIAKGEDRAQKQYTVASGDPSWTASDGTRMSFTAYRKQ